MTSVKQKLLELVEDTNLDDMQTSRLVDLLADKIKKLEAELKHEEGRNAQLAQNLHDERERLQRERQDMRRDPTYWVAGAYGFDSGKDKYIVEIKNGLVTLLRKSDGYMHHVNAVPMESVYGK